MSWSLSWTLAALPTPPTGSPNGSESKRPGPATSPPCRGFSGESAPRGPPGHGHPGFIAFRDEAPVGYISYAHTGIPREHRHPAVARHHLELDDDEVYPLISTFCPNSGRRKRHRFPARVAQH